MRRLLATALMLLGTPFAAANAADMQGSASYDWSGIYGGVLLGYATGRTTADGNPGFDGSAPDDRARISPDGFGGGGIAGINWQRGPFVYGLEGELGYLGARDSLWFPDGDDYFANTEYGFYGALAARLGYAMDRTLLSARGGLIIADIDYGFGDIDGGIAGAPDPTASVIDSKVRAGLLMGAAVEHAFDERWIGRLDYAFAYFAGHTETDLDGEDYRIRNNLHMIRIGVVRRF